MTLPEQAALTFVVLVSVFGIGIVAYGLWVGFWSLYDGLMQRRKRKQNRIERSPYVVGRDAWRDIRGIHR